MRNTSDPSVAGQLRLKNRPFVAHISYQRGDFATARTYAILAKKLAALDKTWNAKSVRIFHLATPPSLIGVISKSLSAAGLARDRQRSRIAIEKPIGADLESARGLNRALTKYFHESQIFRIDHYLGKERPASCATWCRII